MPKKSKGGNRHKKAKNNSDQNDRQNMIYKEDGEEYAIVDKMVGGARCHITLPDQSTKLAIIRGKLRKRRTWISVGDLVLVSIRDYQEDKCDVLHKYTNGQIQTLKRKKSLPDGFLSQFNKTETTEVSNQNKTYDIEFRDASSSEEDDDDPEQDGIDVSYNSNLIVEEAVEEGDDESDKEDDTYNFNFDEI